jgi:hypothetical protein
MSDWTADLHLLSAVYIELPLRAMIVDVLAQSSIKWHLGEYTEMLRRRRSCKKDDWCAPILKEIAISSQKA